MIRIYSGHCKHELYAFQYILDFPILILENKFKLKLLELLKYNLSFENIDFEIKC